MLEHTHTQTHALAIMAACKVDLVLAQLAWRKLAVWLKSAKIRGFFQAWMQAPALRQRFVLVDLSSPAFWPLESVTTPTNRVPRAILPFIRRRYSRKLLLAFEVSVAA